jgi:hypothetical protein
MYIYFIFIKKSKSQKVNEMEIEIECLISNKLQLENDVEEKSKEFINNSNICVS